MAQLEFYKRYIKCPDETDIRNYLPDFGRNHREAADIKNYCLDLDWNRQDKTDVKKYVPELCRIG